MFVFNILLFFFFRESRYLFSGLYRGEGGMAERERETEGERSHCQLPLRKRGGKDVFLLSVLFVFNYLLNVGIFGLRQR